MQMSVSYCSFGGRMLYENRGGVASSYMRDPLGNTIGLLDMNGNQTDSWTYWPYGEVQNHTGSSTTPLRFLGTLGYFVDFLNMLYVRARHLKADLTTWMTVDPYWPREKVYGYCLMNPVYLVDPSGLGIISYCIIGGGLAALLEWIKNGGFGSGGLSNGACKAAINCLAAALGTISGCLGGFIGTDGLTQKILNGINAVLGGIGYEGAKNACTEAAASTPGAYGFAAA